MSVVDETKKSIKAAVTDGTLDPSVSAGPIEALLLVAEQLDHPTFPEINGRLDNVSLPTYLRYAAELRITPASRPEKKESGGDGKLAQLQADQSKRKRSA